MTETASLRDYEVFVSLKPSIVRRTKVAMSLDNLLAHVAVTRATPEEAEDWGIRVANTHRGYPEDAEFVEEVRKHTFRLVAELLPGARLPYDCLDFRKRVRP